jgi:hypothetical protein
MTASAAVRLHLPDAPLARRTGWRAAALDGTELTDVVAGPDGVAGWLWDRWSTLERAGMSRAEFDRVVLSYRREIWLWLTGDRTWEQCCGGLIGRLDRRLPAVG